MLPRPRLAWSLPLDIVRDAASGLVKGYRRFGPIYRIVVPGRRYTVLGGPKANQFLLHGGERHLDSVSVYKGLGRELGTQNYPVLTTGDRHRHIRRVLAPAFSREAISHYVPHMTVGTERIARGWQPGERIRVPAVARLIVSEVLGLAMANRSLGNLLQDGVTFARVSIGAGLGAYPAIARLWPPYLRAKARMGAFLRDVVAEHRREPPGTGRDPDLVDLLLAARNLDGTPFSELDVIANAQMIYSNTLLYTAPAVACLLYALLKSPTVTEQVLAEIDAGFAEGPPSLTTLQRMTLLRGAMKESFRLYPVALSVPRVAAEPFDFEGHRVDAGSRLQLATSVCHFLPECFPDPSVFDPTRYAEPRNEHLRTGAYAPFGLGAHPCLGAGLVEVLVMSTVAALIRTVTLELDPPNYVMRRIVNPFPEPEDRFSVRVLAQRQARAPARRAPDEADVAAALPSLSREALARVAARVHRLTFAPGETIIRQGAASDRFYILTEGRVEVLREHGKDEPVVLAYLESGAYFGEIGLLHKVARMATVRAVGAVTALALDQADFEQIVAESDLTAAEISEVVQRRMRSARLADALPGLSPDHLARVMPRVEPLRYPAGATIIRQGDRADRFFLLARGEAEVLNHHPSGEDIVLATLGPGDYFGEVGLVQERPRMATVRALTEVETLTLDIDGFRSLLSDSERTSRQIAAVISERLAASARGPASPGAAETPAAPSLPDRRGG
jgi:CRP-like cAMP-binding protein/cytochrome P450